MLIWRDRTVCESDLVLNGTRVHTFRKPQFKSEVALFGLDLIVVLQESEVVYSKVL